MALPAWMVQTTSSLGGDEDCDYSTTKELHKIVKPLRAAVDADWQQHKALDEAHANRIAHANEGALSYLSRVLQMLDLENNMSDDGVSGMIFCLVGGNHWQICARMDERLEKISPLEPAIIYGLHLVVGGTVRLLKWERNWDNQVTRLCWQGRVYLPSKEFGPVLRGMVSSITPSPGKPWLELELIPEEKPESD